MRAIIMAAGVGSRLQTLSAGKPKCLIQADTETLLGRLIRQLRSRDIHDITVITGFKSQLIRDEVGADVRTIHNPFFRVTNSIASLWLARELLTGDTLLMNADLYLEPAVLDIAIAQTHPVAMLSDNRRIETADFRFRCEGDRIVEAGKHISNEHTDCEYVGVVRLDGSIIGTYRERLEEMIKKGCFGDWWEAVLYSFMGTDVDIMSVDVEGAFWTEVDHAADFQRLTDWLERLPLPGRNRSERDLGQASSQP